MRSDRHQQRHWTRTAGFVLLAVGLPVLAATALYVWGSSTLDELAMELADKQKASTRLKQSIEAARRLEAAADPDEKAALAADFLVGSQDPIIIADVQNRLRALAMSSNIELNSATALPARQIEGNVYIGVRVNFRGQLPDIQKLAHGIETSSPLLFIDRVSIRADSWAIRSADPDADGAPAVIAEMDILGAKLPAGAAQFARSTASSPGPVTSQPVGETVGRPPQPSLRGGRRS